MLHTSNRNPYKWLNVIGFVLVIVMNALANLLPIGGRTTSEVSALYPVLITPAGYAFSIWSVIYAFLAGLIILQFLPSQKQRNTAAVLKYWFFISCLANASWIVLWQNLWFGWSVLVIIILLFSLSQMYVRALSLKDPSTGEKWFIQLPFRIYLGWVSVATIINVTVWLNKMGWNGFGLGDETWAVLLLIVGAIVAIAVSFTYRDAILPLVFVWAYIAIGVKQSDVLPVYYAAVIIAVVLLLYSIWLFFFKRKR
ncbi:tryptophan-rich sensory protein [Neobacillus mesonae]|nr:tryptophan-rich sensory protein [Neobacillus mesonae]